MLIAQILVCRHDGKKLRAFILPGVRDRMRLSPEMSATPDRSGTLLDLPDTDSLRFVIFLMY